ncbi:MAG TPA: DUF2147 domain-containing protein [Xanthobacteraceae bacterium]|nr:DUF2147 domain-containing protein [Xanthobacteraceae bacterium]
MKFGQTCLRTPLGLLAIIFIMTTSPARANVEGLWQHKGGTLRLRNCGDGVCGTIASVNPHLDPATGQPPTDKKNADPNLRRRPLVGLSVVMGMHPSGPGKWTGRLYNVEDGNTYTGSLIELGPDTIRLEGCALFFCGGENLTRIRSSTFTR